MWGLYFIPYFTVFYLVTSCGSPAAGRGATSGKAEALCSCMDFVLVDALAILSICLNPDIARNDETTFKGGSK